MKIQKLFAKEVLIRLTDEGFVSTIRYGGMFAKSASWITPCSGAFNANYIDSVGQLPPDTWEVDTQDFQQHRLFGK